jgi:hypothetical protein
MMPCACAALPGTAVPGYRLCRPYGTVFVVAIEGRVYRKSEHATQGAEEGVSNRKSNRRSPVIHTPSKSPALQCLSSRLQAGFATKTVP